MEEEITTEVNIVKEGSKFYEKKEVDIEAQISYQESIIVGLQTQINKAQATIDELQALK